MAGKIFTRASGVFLTLALTATGALAQEQPELTSAQRAELRDIALTCRRDVSSFCKDVERGNGRILVCLQDHADSVSDACRGMLDAAQALVAEIEAASGG